MQRLSNVRLSVSAYLAAAFVACIAAVGVLMAVTTASSFSREKDGAAIELKAAAQVNADTAGRTVPETLQFLQKLAEQPELTSLDPGQCRVALSGLAGILSAPGERGHLEVYRPDGSLVCGLGASPSEQAQLSKGTWFARTIATGQAVDGGTAIDSVTGVPSLTIALPIVADSGHTGVLSVTFATGATPVALPAGAPRQMVLVELDPTRRIVLAASSASPVKVGPAPVTSWMVRRAGPGTRVRTVRDADGVTRLYSEATASNGWHVIAGMPRSVALAAAQAELRRNLAVGAAIALLVAGLGFVISRRLARPIRRLGQAIEAAKNDNTARAPLSGPIEVAAVAAAFNDTIEERRQLEEQLSHQALHDPLTGLANRALLDDRLAMALARRRGRSTARLAVLFFDLDRFKVINDSYGHERGDQVLVAVSQRLEHALRPGDTVARFGGDEFVVLAEGVTNERSAYDVASRLLAALQPPFHIDDAETHVTATVGIAVAGPDSTAGDLLRDADAAMYRGKERARGGIEIFDQQLGAKARNRADLEAALRRGLQQNELVVHYQPEVEVATGQMVGVEALVRWARPRHGMVPPGEFIPIAEETGLIIELGDFVLQRACEQLVSWQQDGVDLTVSVNLSPRQLTDPNLPKRVAAILDDTGATADHLVLEMTESALVEDDPRTMDVLGGLKELGVRLALDDFGTGYASLSYLRHFPVDVVKVDRSFVGDLGRSGGGGAIVAAVLAMGASLGLVTVAEGVEQPKQLGALEEMGCQLAQGFYLAKPQEAHEILKLAGRNLRTRRKTTSARTKVS